MQIDLLETYLDLMETSSFNKTAERLGVTQSTVSGRVQALETRLGRKLFNRNRAGTSPTPAGQKFHESARAICHEWAIGQRSVQAAGDFGRTINIGLQHDLAANQVGDWVASFRQAIPQNAFYVELDYSMQMCRDLLSGVLDMAVVYTPKNLPDLHFEQIGHITYCMISTDTKTTKDIDPKRYIFTNYSPSFSMMHREILPDITSGPVASGQNIAVCSMLTALGGTAYIAEDSVDTLLAREGFRRVEDAPPIRQDVYYGVHLGLRHAPVQRKLRDIVRSQFSKAK